MNLTHKGWKISGAAVVMAITFALGYWTGSRQATSKVEAPAALTSSDMEHAFGEISEAVHESGENTSSQDTMAKSLGDLVAGLEKKVAANPENLDQQLLLAQTYNELGRHDKGLALLHELSRKNPKDAQVKITLATVLLKGGTKEELKESIKMFDEAIKLKPDAANMARMYQGEARGKLEALSKQ